MAHWIEVALVPVGREHGSVFLDLERVTEVWPAYDGDDLTSVRVRYDGYHDYKVVQNQDGSNRYLESDGAITFDKEAGDFFLGEWMSFLRCGDSDGLMASQKPRRAADSNIHVVRSKV